MAYSPSNRGRLLDYLRKENGSYYCDDCLEEMLDIHPRQQVNQICRQFAEKNEIDRIKAACDNGHKKKLVNCSSS